MEGESRTDLMHMGPILRGRSRGKEAKGISILCEREWSNQLTAEVHVNVGQSTTLTHRGEPRRARHTRCRL